MKTKYIVMIIILIMIGITYNQIKENNKYKTTKVLTEEEKKELIYKKDENRSNITSTVYERKDSKEIINSLIKR